MIQETKLAVTEIKMDFSVNINRHLMIALIIY